MPIQSSVITSLTSNQRVFPIHIMTPVWVFPAYPLLMSAPFGANLISAAYNAGEIGSINTIAIAMAAITVQGTGFLIGFMVCAAFLYRLMTQKLPRDAQRPGVFISIGPSAFTAAGIGSSFPPRPCIFESCIHMQSTHLQGTHTPTIN